MWIYYNPNPKGKHTDDCVVRAIAKAFDVSWQKAKIFVDVYSMEESEVETSDIVWSRILAENGFKMKPLYCDGKCDLKGFCEENPKGVYVVKLPNHVVCVKDGDYFDSWDSGDEKPLYCWEKK